MSMIHSSIPPDKTVCADSQTGSRAAVSSAIAVTSHDGPAAGPVPVTPAPSSSTVQLQSNNFTEAAFLLEIDNILSACLSLDVVQMCVGSSVRIIQTQSRIEDDEI